MPLRDEEDKNGLWASAYFRPDAPLPLPRRVPLGILPFSSCHQDWRMCSLPNPWQGAAIGFSLAIAIPKEAEWTERCRKRIKTLRS